MGRYVHDADDKVYACPHCDEVPVYRRTGENVQVGSAPFICYACGEPFDEPVERAARPSPGPPANGQPELEASDPEDLLDGESDA